MLGGTLRDIVTGLPAFEAETRQICFLGMSGNIGFHFVCHDGDGGNFAGMQQLKANAGAWVVELDPFS
jgi:hypothetical protein